jgi:peroxiredoxin family protein
MAEMLIWCCEGSFSSIGTNLFLATQLRGAGVDVAILFDTEALVALAERKFGYEPTPLLKRHEATIQKNMKAVGFSTEVAEYLKAAAAARVPLYACAGWAGFLGVAQKLPAEIKVIEIAEVVKLLAQAKRITGGP